MTEPETAHYLEHNFKIFADRVYPKAPERQLTELRRTFYAGAHLALAHHETPNHPFIHNLQVVTYKVLSEYEREALKRAQAHG